MPLETVVSLVINDEPLRRLVPSHRSLLDFLREDLDLTGSKHGCDVGDCGACTVLVNGVPRLSCITLAADVEGSAVRTIEGVAGSGCLTRFQTALDRHVAAQCGYCTPGIVMAMTALLDETPTPDEAEIRECLAANICRCTGYTKILAAAREACSTSTPDSSRASQ